MSVSQHFYISRDPFPRECFAILKRMLRDPVAGMAQNKIVFNQLLDEKKYCKKKEAVPKVRRQPLSTLNF